MITFEAVTHQVDEELTVRITSIFAITTAPTKWKKVSLSILGSRDKGELSTVSRCFQAMDCVIAPIPEGDFRYHSAYHNQIK